MAPLEAPFFVHGIGDEALGSFGASSKMNNDWAFLRHLHQIGWPGFAGARASQAVAGEIDAVRVVDDAIENGVGIGRIAGDIVPLVDGGFDW